MLLLSPMIGEVLSGATRLSFIFVLVPEIMVWGCGTLLIREAARRWVAGWPSMLLLALGLAIAEEFLIQQTSIAPLPWLGSAAAYGRVFGINWLYFLYMLGYEAVWIVLVPIAVTELIFPRHAHEPWLRRNGLVATSAAFLFGSFIAWFLWTQNARPNVFHVPKYHPPAVTLALGAAAIVALVVGAYALRRWPVGSGIHAAPPAWTMIPAALLLGFPWYGLLVLVFVPQPKLPLVIPMAAGCIWGFVAFALAFRWTTGAGWSDGHRWALALGALLVCMIGGFLGSNLWSRLDVVAKVVLNVAAIVAMVRLGIRTAKASEVTTAV